MCRFYEGVPDNVDNIDVESVAAAAEVAARALHALAVGDADAAGTLQARSNPHERHDAASTRIVGHYLAPDDRPNLQRVTVMRWPSLSSRWTMSREKIAFLGWGRDSIEGHRHSHNEAQARCQLVSKARISAQNGTLHSWPLAQVNSSAVAARVNDLVACLVADAPGLTCPLATALMSAFGPAERYVGVLRSPTRDSQDPDPAAKGNLARFLWNHLATMTAQVHSRVRYTRSTKFRRSDQPPVFSISSSGPVVPLNSSWLIAESGRCRPCLCNQGKLLCG